VKSCAANPEPQNNTKLPRNAATHPQTTKPDNGLIHPAAHKSPLRLYVIRTNFDGLAKARCLHISGYRRVSVSIGVYWGVSGVRMRWPHISAATKRARYFPQLVRACVRNGKAIFLCVVLRFQLGLFSSFRRFVYVLFSVRVFPTRCIQLANLLQQK